MASNEIPPVPPTEDEKEIAEIQKKMENLLAESSKRQKEDAGLLLELEENGATPEEIELAKKNFTELETPEGKVGLARARYIPEYLKVKKEKGRFSILRFSIFGNEDRFSKLNLNDNSTEKYTRLKKEYDEARVGMGNDLFEKRKAVLEEAGLSGDELAQAMVEYKSTEILQKTIIDERQKLIDAGAEGQPVNPALWKKLLDGYMGIKPRWKKVAISTALFLPVAATGAVGGAMISGMGFTAGITALAGYKFAKSMASGWLVMHAGKGIDWGMKGRDKDFKMSQENTKESLKGAFGRGEMSQEIYEGRLDELEKREKSRSRNRMLAKAAVGIALGMGTSMGVAHTEMSHLSTGGVHDNIPQGTGSPREIFPKDQTQRANESAGLAAEEKAKLAEATIAEKARLARIVAEEKAKPAETVQPRNLKLAEMKGGEKDKVGDVGGKVEGKVLQQELAGGKRPIIRRLTPEVIPGEEEELIQLLKINTLHPQATSDPIEGETHSSGLPENYDAENDGMGNDLYPLERPTTEAPIPLEARPQVQIRQNISPTRGGFNTGGVASISPTHGVFNTGGVGTIPFRATAPGEITVGSGDNGFTTRVPMTDVETLEIARVKAEAIARANILRGQTEQHTGVEYGHEVARPAGGANALENPNVKVMDVTQDGRHVGNVDELKVRFGKHDLIVEKPDGHFHGGNYQDWNETTDQIFQANNLDFTSYEQYMEAKFYQNIFGGTIRVMQGPDVGRLNITYYAQDPERFLNKIRVIPAKDLMNFNKHDLAEMASKNPNGLRNLIETGLVKNISHGGKPIFEYTDGSRELERLQRIMKKIDPTDYKPRNGETIGQYVERAAHEKKIIETADGSLCAYKGGFKLEPGADQVVPRGGIVNNPQMMPGQYGQAPIYNTSPYERPVFIRGGVYGSDGNIYPRGQATGSIGGRMSYEVPMTNEALYERYDNFGQGRDYRLGRDLGEIFADGLIRGINRGRGY